MRRVFSSVREGRVGEAIEMGGSHCHEIWTMVLFYSLPDYLTSYCSIFVMHCKIELHSSNSNKNNNNNNNKSNKNDDDGDIDNNMFTIISDALFGYKALFHHSCFCNSIPSPTQRKYPSLRCLFLYVVTTRCPAHKKLKLIKSSVWI